VNLGALGFSTVSIEDVSIDDNGDEDWYAVTVANNTQMDIALNPVSFTYLEGQQNANVSCTAGTSFNSLPLKNLGVEIRGTNGIDVIASANANPAGQSETLDDIQLVLSGTYFVRVFGGINNDVQLYNLDLVLQNGDPNLAPPNDDCVNAICVSDGEVVNATTTNASGNTIAGCDFSDSQDVWFTYTPAENDPNVTIILCDSDFDTTLAVLEDCNDLVLIACNDDFCGV